MLKINEYFDGQVKSISFQSRTLPATVGVMVKGTYEFSTDAKETMTVVSGELAVQYPGQTSWQTFVEGQSFDVEAKSSFKVNAIMDTAYLCQFWR
jgi:purine/pyrimidine-nucleoside phosphorylase